VSAAVEVQSDEVQSEIMHRASPRGRASRTSLFAKYSARILRGLSRETTSGRFIPEMDGLRFAAIAMVVLFHLNGYLTAKTTFYERASIAPGWLCRVALLGSHGVELFFVISGFILALPFAAYHLAGAPVVSLRKYICAASPAWSLLISLPSFCWWLWEFGSTRAPRPLSSRTWPPAWVICTTSFTGPRAQ